MFPERELLFQLLPKAHENQRKIIEENSTLAGLRGIIQLGVDYLGLHPMLTVKKCVLKIRKIPPILEGTVPLGEVWDVL